jgi:hypothetical protein
MIKSEASFMSKEKKDKNLSAKLNAKDISKTLKKIEVIAKDYDKAVPTLKELAEQKNKEAAKLLASKMEHSDIMGALNREAEDYQRSNQKKKDAIELILEVVGKDEAKLCRDTALEFQDQCLLKVLAELGYDLE